MKSLIGKTMFGSASIAVLIILSSSLAQAAGQSLRNDCKLDKNGNGPRHCQCDALHHKLLPSKILWRLASMNVCNVFQTGNGSESSSSRPSDDCDSPSDNSGDVKEE